MIALSFLIFLAIFVAIGVSSNRFSQPSRRSYLLANQDVRPWLVGLSAVATNNSGYMFIGVIGYTYVTGLAATWLMFGWIVGDFLASSFTHRRLRSAAATNSGNTFPSLLANWHGKENIWLKRLSGVVVILFLGTYAAAQLSAGSKTLFVLFDWPLYAGATIGAGIVLLYCLAGGIRASIWTDAAQSVVMLTAMAVILIASISSLGGVQATWQQLGQVSPGYLQLFPPDLPFGNFYGPALFVIGWLFAGFSVIGQPHVMIRFMAIDREESINRARLYYYLWFIAFYFVANAVALTSRALLPEAASFDPELALPTIALELLHPAMVGLVLAGIFAATMSTADSLILSCAGSLTEDLTELPNKVFIPKLATLAVTGFALWLALTDDRSVFDLVISSWAVLAASFAPLLVVLCFGQRPTQGLMIVMVLSGLVCVYAWTRIEILGAFYEGSLGICCGFLVFLVGKMLGQCDSKVG
ncbi:MAG: sodium:proline symporter [Pseudohongiella sp.]|nr:MAG: sodium:proline symporter [Pseudohongiella sp.]